MTLFVGLSWDGYSVASQTPSELAAIGAPTRPLWMLLGAVYAALMAAFGWSVWKAGSSIRPLRFAGLTLAVHAAFGLLWPPMHQRAVLAAGGATLTDALHLVWAMATGLMFVIAMTFGGAGFGRRFRAYSIITMAIVLACGMWTVTYASRLQANLPTPWVGVWERISIAAVMLWIAILAAALMRKGIDAVIQGKVPPGFDAVRDAFANNFARRHETGGACAVYRDGEQMVDLWGGVRNKHTGEPWNEDTMVVVHSATIGLAAMTLAIAHSRGWLDYDERVCTYWPEFAQQGKQRITVRQLLAHHAGLFAINEPSIEGPSPIPIASPSSWRARRRLGRPEPARPITP
jgi:hypothetical protein